MSKNDLLIQENPVKAAIELAHQVDIPLDPAAAKTKLNRKRYELRRLEDLKADLLPMESSSKEELDNKLKRLRTEIEALCGALVPSPHTMPIFDLTCLTWRDEQGFPRLVPYDLSTSATKIAFVIKVKRTWSGAVYSSGGYISPKLPKDLKVCYKDVFDTLRGMRKKGKGIEISTKFEGTIPDDIRDLITGAKSVFPELYIVAEAANWTIQHKDAPKRKVSPDPLVVGWDGKNYRLVASFDMTTVEKLAAERSKGKRPV